MNNPCDYEYDGVVVDVKSKLEHVLDLNIRDELKERPNCELVTIILPRRAKVKVGDKLMIKVWRL